MGKVAKKYVIAIIFDKWTQILTENGVFHIRCQKQETLSVGHFF